MNKYIVIGLLVCGVLVFLSMLFLNSHNPKIEDKSETKLYSGPVRPTDDEEYFRQTGITKPLEIVE